jgi:hypothetical protein
MCNPPRIGVGEDTPDGLNSPRYRRILIQRQMCPGIVVILHIRKEYVAQVPLTEDNDMIKTFPSDRANQPFRRPCHFVSALAAP